VRHVTAIPCSSYRDDAVSFREREEEMHSTKNLTIGRVGRLATLAALTAVLAAALAGQAAAYVVIDKPQVTHSTAAGIRADGARWNAMADAYQNRPASSYYTPQALQAQGLRWDAMAKAYQGQSHPVATSSSSGGFDWRDGLIGVAGAVGLVVCGMGTLIVAARSRRQHEVPA
jgi:hypothetical protein